jgi:formate dehydrogenase subunit delta
MNADKLIRMANDIGDFFGAMPEREEALQGIAGHIGRFWEQRMQGELARYIDENNGEGLSPIVLEALRGFPGGRPL